ncbi:hypothetical protein [Compostibacter hankyongensis]|uniref:MarR family transcriptional regulator n=1 Tax=Compostibacter hankyongensis TaxID=1007089 RepID=A0ABP8FZ61_9BACT
MAANNPYTDPVLAEKIMLYLYEPEKSGQRISVGDMARLWNIDTDKVTTTCRELYENKPDEFEVDDAGYPSMIELR